MHGVSRWSNFPKKSRNRCHILPRAASRRPAPACRLEPGANVTRDVGSEPVELLHSRKHLGDKPQPAQGEERLPPERQVEVDLLDLHVELAEPDCGPAAHPLDGGIDPDSGDIGAVGDPQALRDAAAAAATKLRPAVGWERGESGLGPATACSIRATSAAVRAMGPSTWSVSHAQSDGYVGTSPTDGRSPTTPQNDAEYAATRPGPSPRRA